MVGKSSRVWRFAALFFAWMLAVAFLPIAASAQEGEAPPPPPAEEVSDAGEVIIDDMDGDGSDLTEDAHEGHDHGADAQVLNDLNCDITSGNSEFAHCVAVDALARWGTRVGWQRHLDGERVGV